MYSDTLSESSYKKTIAFLALVCSVFAFLTIFAGYIALPFATAFYATLLIYENPAKRIFSYCIPIVFFVLNFSINGLYSLEGISYVLLGWLLFLFYRKGISKGATAFYLSALVFFFLIVSVIFIFFDFLGEPSFSLLTEALRDFLAKQREAFSEVMLSLLNNVEGTLQFQYNFVDVDTLFNYLILSVFPFFALFAFLIIGISLKFFSLNLRHFSVDTKKINSWIFTASNFVAYLYLIISLVSMLVAYGNNAFYLTLSFASSVLCFVFSYLGFKFIYHLLRRKFKSIIAVLILIGACIIIPIVVSVNILIIIQFVSYIGVFFTLTFNKMSRYGMNK